MAAKHLKADVQVICFKRLLMTQSGQLQTKALGHDVLWDFADDLYLGDGIRAPMPDIRNIE